MAGRGQTSADDVFINCPFDDEYAPTFRAQIFAVYVCGLRTRSAREIDDGGQTRIDKLKTIIEETQTASTTFLAGCLSQLAKKISDGLRKMAEQSHGQPAKRSYLPPGRSSSNAASPAVRSSSRAVRPDFCLAMSS